MIGQIITDKDGLPLDNSGNKLAISSYQPSNDVMKLFSRVQRDYQSAWALHHRPFDEFDGVSLLQRARLDQETFGAFVGAEYVPAHKQWRFRGRKNTSRNKIIGILAHLLSGMLYPFVYAKNEQNEEDKMTARVMRILVEEHLRKAGYKNKFLHMVLTALVNPAVFVEVEYVEAMQRVKQRLADGTIKVVEAVDEVLSGLQLYIIPIDEVLLADFYTNDNQKQPYIARVRRISWDTARKLYSDKYYDKDGKDRFDYVIAGMTRIFMAGQDQQTLFDIEWTEADRDFVQEITVKYRDEDLEVTFVGGVFMGEEEDIYNSNPFQHRRLTLVGKEWISIPVYNIAKSGFEPIDPTGRFAYYKSAAAKEYWDDNALNLMQRLVIDATHLDVIKPLFLSGVANVNGTVIAPGATIGMPMSATVTPWSVGPNIAAAYKSIQQQTDDLSESTQDKILQGGADKGVTAYATNKAEVNARIFLGVAGLMIAHLVEEVGMLTMDCIIQHETVGELDASVPESLKMKYKTTLAKSKDKGKNVTNRIIFTDEFHGKTFTQEEKDDVEYDLWKQEGGENTDQRIYKVNPYAFARMTYTMYVDADKIVLKSMNADQDDKIRRFNIMTDPRVSPYTDQKAVVDDFVIEEFGGDDPDRYKAKGDTANVQIPGQTGAPAEQQTNKVVSPLPAKPQIFSR